MHILRFSFYGMESFINQTSAQLIVSYITKLYSYRFLAYRISFIGFLFIKWVKGKKLSFKEKNFLGKSVYKKGKDVQHGQN